MSAYDQLVTAAYNGYLPIVLVDAETADGGMPVYTLSLASQDGAVKAHLKHLFSETPLLRTCALVGLTVGAYMSWDALQAHEK